MARPRHPNKHIDAAVQHAEARGWRVRMSAGHAWAEMYCPHAARDGCIVRVWSTPGRPEEHARRVLSRINACPHAAGATDADA